MLIKVGDLVYIKRNQYLNSRHNNEMWLVIGKGQVGEGNKGFWMQLQNVHNRNKVTYREAMLMKAETDIF
jgi:hypothetical protein